MSVRISLGSAFQKRGSMVDIRAGGVTTSEAARTRGCAVIWDFCGFRGSTEVEVFGPVF